MQIIAQRHKKCEKLRYHDSSKWLVTHELPKYNKLKYKNGRWKYRKFTEKKTRKGIKRKQMNSIQKP